MRDYGRSIRQTIFHHCGLAAIRPPTPHK
ncbi:hypothetical protein PHET_07941 [Paragonimus heterotremus]|uniref:Uncharacterized protein n=1 Tax=Paragonimus heterotremus TaxID=100268 RepID=A0A8J4WVY8_9TREM|nr:hypothetical protein PHET_07941 [Paragonimus heterotremus]